MSRPRKVQPAPKTYTLDEVMRAYARARLDGKKIGTPGNADTYKKIVGGHEGFSQVEAATEVWKQFQPAQIVQGFVDGEGRPVTMRRVIKAWCLLAFATETPPQIRAEALDRITKTMTGMAAVHPVCTEQIELERSIVPKPARVTAKHDADDDGEGPAPFAQFLKETA